MRYGKNLDPPPRIDLEDGEAMDRLAVVAHQRLVPYIGAVVHDRHAAEDVLQDTLLTMLERLPGLRVPESFWPWVYRIASNKIRDHFRRQQRFSAFKHGALHDTDRRSHTTRRETGGLERMIAIESVRELSNAIDEMDWRQQQIIHLRCFEQMPYAQIADRTQMSQNQARLKLHRAKMVLKKRLRALSA